MSFPIEIKNLSYAYPQIKPDSESLWVLDGINLIIEQGEFVAIMGVTGGGKSTLCLSLNGIVPHSTGGTIGGEVLIDGGNTKQQTVADLAQTVGLVFQRPETQLFNMTVEAEIAFGLETLGLPTTEIHEHIDWALDIVGMSRYRQRSPFELSGGQKQRVAIAAILALKPPVLVLDEPTANLDPAGKREVFTAVNRLRQQESMTIIMVSHEAEQIATFADRVVVLDTGKIVLDQPPSAVFSPSNQLQILGLNVPQLSQLADRLNHKLQSAFVFDQLEDSVNQLKHSVDNQQLFLNLDLLIEKTDPAVKPNRPIFTVDNLSFGYSNDSTVLNNVSLQIADGDFVAILGQNGSGKTTLVKQLNGLLRPTSGKVWFNQKQVEGLSIAELARSIGFVFQNPDHMIFSPTVWEEVAAGPLNLGLPDAEIKTRVDEALALFDLEQYAEVQPALLSFGLRRKVSVAAVVAMQTRVLILDEPTSGLDARSTAEMMRLLRKLNAQGHTILMITHDMQVVADHIPKVILMKDGENIFQGKTEDLYAQSDLLEEAGLERPIIAELARQLGLDPSIITLEAFLDQIDQVKG